MDALVFLLPLLLMVGLWFVMVRPVRQRQRQVAVTQQQAQVGDRVMTTAGIYGDIEWFDADTFGLRVSEGVVLTYARAAIAQVIAPSAQDEG